jgi:hypothetical protein
MAYERDSEREAHWRGIAKPMPRRRKEIQAPDCYTSEESLRLGPPLLPREMEDKWMAWLDVEGCVLDFQRSWTGFHIYRVHVVGNDDDTLSIERVEVNRDPEQYTCTDDAYDADLVRWLIRALLLQQPVPFPVPPDLAGASAAIAAWSTAGSALPGVPEPGFDVTTPPRPPSPPACEDGCPGSTLKASPEVPPC